MISTEEIIQDIKDTEREIKAYKKELEVLNENPVVNKLGIFVREGRISQRKEFIDKLNGIISERNGKS